MKSLFVVAALMFAFNSNATLLTIDFENASGSGFGAFVTDGFVLDPGKRDWTPNALPYPEGGPWTGHYHLMDPNGLGWSANNGTRYFGFDYFFDDSILNVYAASGGVFGIKQFDLAEGSVLDGSASGQVYCKPDRNSGITFVGYLAEGGTISQRANFDMVCDGAGPLADFQTFTFDGQWNRLTAFSIVPDFAYANPGLDNLVLRAVPEPATLALFALGLAGLGFSRRRKA
jgi:PEP-CTERM motif